MELSNGEMISRRTFLARAAALAGGGCVAARNFLIVPEASAKVPPASSSLKELAASRNLLYGAAATKTHLSKDPAFADAFAAQCNILVPEVELKWDALRPTPDTFNFGPVDWLQHFAGAHQMKFRGHPLVWYQSLPKWLDSYATPQNAKGLMLNHISTVVSRYAGKVHSWDVVNEALDPNERRPDGLRSKPWTNLIGPDYIDMAFHAAAQADPRALLVWNENHLETRETWAQAKREAMLKNLQERLKRNVPIQAIGLQSHLPGTSPTFNYPEFTSFLAKVSDLGLKIIVSEMDVIDSDLPADVGVRDQTVANIYLDYLSTVLREKSVVAVLTWGISNRYSWIAGYKPRKDNAQARPLPLDDNYQPTPAWNALARALEQAPSRNGLS
jgi:endo-1,4-beta-xylanase